jgi:hypothetical protein
VRPVTLFAPVALSVGLLVTFGCGSSAAKTKPVPRATALAPLTLGFSSGADVALASGNTATQAFWVRKARAERAQMVRLTVYWNQVAPNALPSNFVASNPADPSYSWTKVDEQVRELSAAGFKIMIVIDAAPTWTEGPNMPKSATPGTWEPSAPDLGQFAQAIATRYDGSFADPLNPGKVLPRISIWQAWDEPNLPEYLSPQWSGNGASGYHPVSPNLYRSMEDAFYTAVKGVSVSNYVVLAGVGPYGDPPGTGSTDRMQPVEFERELLCVTAQFTLEGACNDPADFDAIDSHPYGIYGPNWHALNADDVSVPDVYKLVNVLHAAEKLGTAMPAGPKGNWVTETSWDTNPPDPNGVPIQEQARWMEQAFYNLWKQGVSTVLWWQIEDSPPIPNYASTYQAGTYYLDGQAKPSATAFRFPFITWRKNYKTVVTWSRSPAAGVLSIQDLILGKWKSVAKVRVSANQVFEVPVHLIFKRKLRAKIGSYISLPWTQAG